MHTEANAAVDSKGIPAASKGAWLPLCPGAPFLLLCPQLSLKSEGPRCLRCAWADADVVSLKVCPPPMLFFLQGIRNSEWY